MIALDGVKLAIYGGIVAALFAIGFAAGHRWQAGEVADAEKAQAAAEVDRDKWQAAAGEWERAQGLWERRYADDQAEAKRQRAEARKAMDLLAEQEHTARIDAEKWRRRFDLSKQEPSCRALMEESECSAFSDY